MNKTALVIRHQKSVHLGILADILKNNNFDIHQIDLYKNDISKINPLDHDIVISLGGGFGAYNTEQYPYLKTEVEFLKKRIEADKPTLGICLGAQMIAAALGAKVYVGSQGMELGWKPLNVNEQGQNSPVRHFDGELTQMMFSHGDTFDLPEGTTLLASTPQYSNQAFTYGKNIMALQFHPEVDIDVVEEFLILLVGKLSGSNTLYDIHQIRKDTKENADIMKEQTSKFFKEWLEVIE